MMNAYRINEASGVGQDMEDILAGKELADLVTLPYGKDDPLSPIMPGNFNRLPLHGLVSPPRFANRA